MARTERESDSRREMTDLLVLPTQQRACTMAQDSAEKLEHTGPAEKKKSGLSATERAVGKNAGGALSKRKRNRAVCPKHQIMRGRESRWARERGIRARALSGKGGLHCEQRQIPRRKDRATKKSLPRTSRRKHERVSRRKSSPGRSAELWFHSKSGQT